MEENISEILKVRQDKLAQLVENGKNPFEIVKFPKDAYAQTIKDNFDNYDQKQVKIAGRLMSKRVMGKASFAHVMDGTGQIQLYASRDGMGEENYAEFKKFDIGDIVGVEGFVFKTQTGEISVHVQKMTLLAKSLLPLPEKFHGLTNVDLRYRQRYVDLIANPEVKNTFVLRSKIINAIRSFLDNEGFVDIRLEIA